MDKKQLTETDIRTKFITPAVVEAKDNTHGVGDGMQQALEYAEMLDVPFAYSSNGDAFLEHDRTTTSGTVTREIALDAFPSPDELWSRYRRGLRRNRASPISRFERPIDHRITQRLFANHGPQRIPIA